MFDNYIQSLATNLLPVKNKRNPNGWISFNCPACVHRGQQRPDTRQRGGMMYLTGGGIRYNCFNCKLSTSWQPGFALGNFTKKVLSWFGASREDIDKAAFEAFKIKEESPELADFTSEETKHLQTSTLPKDSKPIMQLVEEGFDNFRFLQAIEYLQSRHEDLLFWYNDFHWSPEFPERIIVPLKHQGIVYGWVGRLTRAPKNSSEPPYITRSSVEQEKFLFNADALFAKTGKYVIVSEGLLDAIALSGVATLGNSISEVQLKWLNSSDKEIIVLADRDKAGQDLIDIALDNGWPVSFPPFDDDIKDGFDAAIKYGRPMALKLIIDYKEDNPLKINIKRRDWVSQKHSRD